MGCRSGTLFLTDEDPAVRQVHVRRYLQVVGRVYRDKPAPDNLEVPPHVYLSDSRILIGEEKRA